MERCTYNLHIPIEFKFTCFEYGHWNRSSPPLSFPRTDWDDIDSLLLNCPRKWPHLETNPWKSEAGTSVDYTTLSWRYGNRLWRPSSGSSSTSCRRTQRTGTYECTRPFPAKFWAVLTLGQLFAYHPVNTHRILRLCRGSSWCLTFDLSSYFLYWSHFSIETSITHHMSWTTRSSDAVSFLM